MNNEPKVNVISRFGCQQRVRSELNFVESLLQTVFLMSVDPQNDEVSTLPPLTIPFPPPPSTCIA